jgi:hypothetical protein
MKAYSAQVYWACVALDYIALNHDIWGHFSHLMTSLRPGAVVSGVLLIGVVLILLLRVLPRCRRRCSPKG